MVLQIDLDRLGGSYNLINPTKPLLGWGGFGLPKAVKPCLVHFGERGHLP